MSARDKLRVAILLSGRGSNMAAIAAECASGHINASVVGVIADNAGAGGIAWAERLGLVTQIVATTQFQGRRDYEAALEATLTRWRTELVVLAGFMRVLSEPFVLHYSGRLLNIHPSLLPRHKGLRTHQRVLQAGEREHGASVHFVTAQLDSGPVIYQGRLHVGASDTEQSLTARVQRLEHRIYPKVIGLIAAGRLRLEGAAVLLDGKALVAPLIEEEPADAAARA